MLTKFFLSNLAILTFGCLPAVASPDDASEKTWTVSQWSDLPTQPISTPQWNNPTDEAIAAPHWSELSDARPPKPSEEVPVASPPISPQQLTESASQTPSNEINEAQTPFLDDSELLTPAANRNATDSPITNGQFQQPTAETLGQGEVVINAYNRLFFLEGEVENVGTAANFGSGFSWGVTDSTELTLEFQHVDSGSPGRQGNFTVFRSSDNEFAFEAKQRLWQNAAQTQTLSGIVSLSVGERGFEFIQNNVIVAEDEDQDLVPGLQLPYTVSVNDRLQLTVAPTVAFFGEENALFLSRLPGEDEKFGTTFGFMGAVSYQVHPRITLWGDAFIPVTGANSINRDSGLPDEAIAYNAGFRYLVNPRVAIDFFASNTLGSQSSLALTADQDNTAFGANVVFMPDFIGANRRYGDSFSGEDREATPLIPGGLGFFDGGVLANGRFFFSVKGGTQGVLTALRYGAVEDLEVGIYLDYISSDVDESEQGLSGKIRLLNQAEGAPLTASLAATLGLTNQPIVNFANNNRNEFDRRDLDKEVPFLLNGDEGPDERLYVVTLSLPLSYQFDNGIDVWLTPMLGFLQRNGTELAGFNVGGSVPVLQQFSVLGEVGANFAEEGNAFIDSTRTNEIPWTVALRWDPSVFLGLELGENSDRPQLEVYVTNRVGFSPWHQLRVRDQNDAAVGVGLSVPF